MADDELRGMAQGIEWSDMRHSKLNHHREKVLALFWAAGSAVFVVIAWFTFNTDRAAPTMFGVMVGANLLRARWHAKQEDAAQEAMDRWLERHPGLSIVVEEGSP